MLYIWAAGSSADHAYFYKVDCQPAILDGEAVYEKVALWKTSEGVLNLLKFHRQ
jgi:hypothetical protein